MSHRRKQNSLLLIALVMFTVNPAIVVAAEKAHPGQANFEDFCAACHGYDGVPILPGAPNFFKGERLNNKDSELLKTIRHGKGDVMPPWKETLNEQSIKDVLDYIKDVIHQKSFD